MFGMRHWEGRCGGKWGGRHGRHGRRRGWGGGEGSGDDELLRARRMLAHGDLRLIALALIVEQPRHGYEIIKVLEDKTGGWYSPSPGMVYPTLTYLEETGFVTAQAEGSKKLYTVTEEGRAHVEENQAVIDAALERLTAVGEQVARWRRRSEARRGPAVPPLVEAALDNLREVAAKRLEGDEEAEPRIVEILARTAAELRRT